VRLVVAIALVLSLGHTAHADDAGAKALFDQGKALFADGKFSEACTKLEASYKMNQLSGTRGLLGACYEKLGRFASAWAAYRDSAVIAEKQGNTERAAAARASAAELEPKLAWLTIDATAVAKTPKLKITIDGVEYPREALGSRIPVDAGQHLLEATAIDYKSWNQTIDITDTEKQHATIPQLVEDPTRRLAIEKRLADERRVARRRKQIAFGLGIGGGVSLGVATTLTLMARSGWNHAKDLGCTDAGVCPDDAGKREVDRAATKADIATYVGGAGLLLVGAGVFIYVTSPKPHTETELRMVPTMSPHGAGVSLEGWF
jgi:hypothetical protein